MKRKAGILLTAVTISLVFGPVISGASDSSSYPINQASNPAEDRHPAWSPDGSKVAFDSDRNGNVDIYVMNADGTDLIRLTDDPNRDQYPAWSPDGSMIAFESNRDGDVEIYVMRTDGSNPINLTNNTFSDWDPCWSPDGTKIAFESFRHGNSEIYLMNADGSDQTNLTNNPANATACSWSPDGSRIAFNTDRDGNVEVYVMNAGGSGQTRLTNNPAHDGLPSWSPDGTKIAFISNRDGNSEIYVMRTDGSGQFRFTDNPEEDQYPAWSPDGTRIAYEADVFDYREICVMDADGSNQTNLTNNAPADRIRTIRTLIPLPQSELNLQEIPFRIVFESFRVTEGEENWEICLINADGSNLINLTNTPEIDELYPHASPDGTRICFVTFEGEALADKSRNVYYMNIDGTGRTKIADNAYQPCWSGDGTRIAYLPGEYSRFNPNSTANKGLEIYDLETKEVIRHPNENIQHLFCLCWSPDGEWFTARSSERAGNIAFMANDTTQMRLTISGCRPDISPDGGRITWGAEDEELCIATLDLSSPENNVVNHKRVIQCDRGFKVYHVDWSPDGNYLTFSYGLEDGSEEVGQRARGWNICICDLSTLKWTNITTDGKDYKEPDWVPVPSSRR